MSKVNFTAMDHGTREDYDLVFAHDIENGSHQAEQVIGWLRAMDGDSPYHVSRLEHCLQTATRAQQDGADEETVVCALLHDIGDVLGPYNHSQLAAALLRPYVGEKKLLGRQIPRTVPGLLLDGAFQPGQKCPGPL